MQESSIEQASMCDGRVRELAGSPWVCNAKWRGDWVREILAHWGERQFGPLSQANRARMEAVEDYESLLLLLGRLNETASWDELPG